MTVNVCTFVFDQEREHVCLTLPLYLFLHMYLLKFNANMSTCAASENMEFYPIFLQKLLPISF
jgi:hypothetical protein